MNIALIHGYFLKGTGSNLFVQNTCRELCKKGHNVYLFCQEFEVSDMDFISSSFDFNLENNFFYLSHYKETPYLGKCNLYRPNLNSFLPVYVYDHYEGYEVKEYTTCKKEEIEKYIECNVKAINAAVENVKIDYVWSNHSIMQSIYVARSELGKRGIKRVMTVHGSCLNFSVRKSVLLSEYALEGIANNHKVVFLSQFSKDEFLDYFTNLKSEENKLVIIPAGVDLDKFIPLKDQNEIKSRINDLKKELKFSKNIDSEPVAVNKSDWKTDSNIIDKLNQINFIDNKIILYYGKYLWTKGIHLLIAAIPMIIKQHPDTKFILVGYGSNRTYFESMIEALNDNRREDFIRLIKNSEQFIRTFETDSSIYFKSLLNKLNNATFADEYFSSAENKIKAKVFFTGFLNHNQLKNLIACATITIAPSVFPEAFGLVAVEALASGVIPIQTNHSAFSEVIKNYSQELLDIFDKDYKQLYLDKDLSLNIAYNINTILSKYDRMSEEEKIRLRQRIRKIAVDYYSWTNMVSEYLEL